MRNKALTLLFFILLLLVLIVLNSCGPGYHLRRAQHHIRKAEEKGAKWSSQTFYKDVSFKVPGIDVKFTPKILAAGEPMVFVKDSVITRVIIKSGQAGRDTVFVDTKCPDRIVQKSVPVSIEKSIKAGKSFGYYLPWFVLVFIIGVVVGYFTRAGPPGRWSISFDKTEKPSN